MTHPPLLYKSCDKTSYRVLMPGSYMFCEGHVEESLILYENLKFNLSIIEIMFNIFTFAFNEEGIV